VVLIHEARKSNMTKNNKDLLWGFIPSLILPIIFMIVYIQLRYWGESTFIEVIDYLFESRHIASLLAVGVMPNLLIFLFSINRERWFLGRGVIAATMLYGITVMIMKLA
jgi:hypothetical protein